MAREDRGNGYQILANSHNNDVIGNTARFCDRTGFIVQASDGNFFDDNWADDNLNGFIISGLAQFNTVTNNRSEDNTNFGILDLGTGNTFSGNISRRNGRD